MRLDDRITGAAVALGGAAYMVEAFGLPTTAGQAYGAGFFPSILGVFFTLSGLALAARGLFGRRQPPAAGTGGDAPLLLGALRFASILGAIVVYYAFADRLGFALTSLLIMTALGLVFAARPLLVATVPFAATAVLSFVFSELLRVPLPVGPLDLF